jgi:hypothetical protein
MSELRQRLDRIPGQNGRTHPGTLYRHLADKLRVRM